MPYNEKSLRRFIHNYDKDNNFLLNYKEFKNIVLPFTDNNLRNETEQRKCKSNNASFNKEFISIITKELELIETLSDIVSELQHSKEFTTYEGFLVIVGEDKYITVLNLGLYLQSKGIEIDNNEILRLMYRIDKDDDGKISYEEFQEIFFPFKEFMELSKEKYSSYRNNKNLNGYNPFKYKSFYMQTNSFRKEIKNNQKYSTDTQPINTYSNNYSNYNINNNNTISYNVHNNNISYNVNNNIISYNVNKNNNNETTLPKQYQCTCSECDHVCSYCCITNEHINNLFTLFKEIITQENNIESLKEQVSFYYQNTTIKNIFSFFDISQRQSISIIDFSEALKKIGLYLPMVDVKIIFKRYDTNADGRIDYKEFTEMIVPKTITDNNTVSDRNKMAVENGFDKNLKDALIKLFGEIVNSEKIIETNRMRLCNGSSMSVYDLFNIVKKKFCSGIYKEDVVKFMECNGKFMTMFEGELLMNKLDKNKDGIVSYDEFLLELSPQF